MRIDPSRWERISRIVRDFVITAGTILFIRITYAQKGALQQQVEVLRETQYTRASALIQAQKELYEKEKWLIATLADEVLTTASRIDDAVRTGECDAEAKKILGDDCAFPEYLEMLCPDLLSQAKRLSSVTKP